MKQRTKIILVGALVVVILFLIPSLVAQLAFRGVQKELANMEGKECLIRVFPHFGNRESISLAEPEDQTEFLAMCRQLEYGGADLMLPDTIRTGSGERAYSIDMIRQAEDGKNIFITLSNWEGNNYTCRGYYGKVMNFSYGVHLDNTQPLYDYLETLFEGQ